MDERRNANDATKNVCFLWGYANWHLVYSELHSLTKRYSVLCVNPILSCKKNCYTKQCFFMWRHSFYEKCQSWEPIFWHFVGKTASGELLRQAKTIKTSQPVKIEYLHFFAQLTFGLGANAKSEQIQLLGLNPGEQRHSTKYIGPIKDKNCNFVCCSWDVILPNFT